MEGHFGKKEIVLLGNPKYDLTYKKINSDLEINKVWKQKINYRKVILWTTTHGAERTTIDCSITFHIYAQTILKWFSNHKNCVLMFRPHPGFFAELIRNSIWTKEDVDSIKRMFLTSENMILDGSSDYGEAYYVSDAVMTEACGILLSYLPTRKRPGYSLPLLECLRNNILKTGERIKVADVGAGTGKLTEMLVS